MFPAEASMSPGLLDSTDVLGAPKFGAQTNEAKRRKDAVVLGAHFFLGISPGFRCDCCASRQCEALETEGAFHFVGISAPTRRIDALQMAFPCIFGVFCLWVVVCVGRTCINFM